MKKKKSVIEKQFKSDDTEINSVIKIIVGIILAFAIVYFAFAIITGEIKIGKKENTKVMIQYEEILAEQTFKQKDEDYFVLYYDFNGDDISIINGVISKLSGTLKTYKVDLNSKFNTQYIENSNAQIKTNPTKITELKVKNPTLIRISNKKIIKFIIGEDKIVEYSNKVK